MPTTHESLDALAEVDRTGRIGRTTIQIGVPSSIVVVGSWVLRLCHVDLDPGAGYDLPADVTAALVAIATAVLAYVMNRPPGPADDTVEAAAGVADPPNKEKN